MFTWKGLKRSITDFVTQCSICQEAKHRNCKPPGLMQPLPPPAGAWQDLTMDFIEGLPSSSGYNSILVIVDRFTKYAHFMPLKHPFSAPQMAQQFLDNIVKLHNTPKSIVSDRDPIFTSTFWKELFKRCETQLALTTAYHPQSDGQSERVNQCLEMYLRCSVHATPTKWSKWLPLAEFWYNSAHHTTLGCSPFKALYGYEPTYGFMPALTDSAPPELHQPLKDRELYSTMLKQQLQAAQLRIKQYADKNRSPREFAIGEKVYLRLQPYAEQSVVSRPYPKIPFKYFGPFSIVKKIGSVAYKLDLPETSQVHPVFHVSQLKEHFPDHTPVFSELPSAAELDIATVFPETILERRLVKRGNTALLQVRIKWSSLPEAMAT